MQSPVLSDVILCNEIRAHASTENVYYGRGLVEVICTSSDVFVSVSDINTERLID